MQKAIFLDRDGTINVDLGYVHKIDDFHFIQGSIDALIELKKMGFLLVLVTNQSGIARGYFTEQQFIQLTEWMDWSLMDRGIALDGIYYCPHHPEGQGDLKQHCDCRKPKEGMFLQAIQDLDIDVTQSFMVGDKKEDMQAAQKAHIAHKVLVKTGKPVTMEAEKQADYLINSITALPNLIKTMTE